MSLARWIIFLLLCGSFFPALAIDRLRIRSEGVIIYSGPGVKFRPLRFGKVGDTLPVASKRVESNGIEFYAVLVEDRGTKGKGRTGYIVVSPSVEVFNDDGTVQVEFANAKALYSSAIHVGFFTMPKDQFIYTVAYERYINAGVYYRGLMGEYLSERLGSTILAFELGNEQDVWRDTSLTTFIAAGSLFSPKEDLVFDGSKNLSYYLHGGFGIRYDADEYSAIGMSIMQVAFFNNNNSKLNFAIGMTLEVGL